MPARLYLDHAATTPIRAAARDAVMEGMARWANPSSPHAEGRAARAALERARGRIAAALGWQGAVIFTSGASEAIALGIGRTKAARIVTSAVEHDSVMRVTADAMRLPVDRDGRLAPLSGAGGEGAMLCAIQHVNSETGVIQPLDAIAAAVRASGGLLFADCAQSAGKLPLPPADLIAIGAHKFGGPPGIGALLVRDLAMLDAGGGQEQGYRGGTENLPAILGMAAALEEGADWMAMAARLRGRLDAGIRAAGGDIVADAAPRIPTIASYRMPGVAARAQLIRFDMAGFAVSAGSACSSGTLKSSPVLAAMGWEPAAADEVIRVSFGPDTDDFTVDRFLSIWRDIAGVTAGRDGGAPPDVGERVGR